MTSDSQILLNKIEADDQHQFLTSVESNWSSHLPMLLLGLEMSNGEVVELGSGEGSTKRLRDYCRAHNRFFHSYDSNQDWADKTGSNYVEDWDRANIWHQCGLLFVDHAPGHHRHAAIRKMADKADIIVIHDTELYGGGDYKFEPLWPLFRYVLHYNRTGGGAGATAVSNTIDLNKFKGLKLGTFLFE